uniref:39S ribosomal protein L1, mitochondrial n=1 Tax=Ciona intestinalis TaxID=7719 RepID=F6ZHL3_CIOIN|nr:39S ribosomal protein L1, mitochondrial isoform X1 [Ciona intestinalis]|eukprot:XP_002126935.1 39S ribosomal protein L1, mitochondrial isoform X1 [Ciona intestinalis]
MNSVNILKFCSRCNATFRSKYQIGPTLTRPPAANLHTNHRNQQLNRASAEMRIANLTQKQGLVRNDVSRVLPLTFRKGRNLEKWKERQKPHQLKFEKEIEITDKPVDDVYLNELYRPQIKGVYETVKLLKKYTVLDYIKQDSVVLLQLDLVENYVGKGKRKKLLSFFDTADLPHPTNIRNKVCLFTDIEEQVELALDNGAVAAGGNELIYKVLSNKVVCDAYLSTQVFSENVIQSHKGLHDKLGRMKPSKKWGTSDDFVEHLRALVTKTIYQNYSNGLICKLKVGRLNQTAEELTANIEFMIRHITSKVPVARKKGTNDKQLVEKASISCFTELLTMDITQLFPEPTEESEFN